MRTAIFAKIANIVKSLKNYRFRGVAENVFKNCNICENCANCEYSKICQKLKFCRVSDNL